VNNGAMTRPLTPDQLVELELIKRCKYKYLRLVDQHRFTELNEVMTDNCSASYSDGKYSFDGLEAIIAFLEESMSSNEFLSSHACHHPEIDLTGTDSSGQQTATGIWKLEDQVIVGDYGVNLRGAAFYQDTYVKTVDGWKLSHTGYQRTFEEMWPQSGIDGLSLHANGFTGMRK